MNRVFKAVAAITVFSGLVVVAGTGILVLAALAEEEDERRRYQAQPPLGNPTWDPRDA